MDIPLYQVDAFAPRPLTGNPAAVCPLEDWLPEELLQAIAGENNLSETAFLVPRGGPQGGYDLRWFTPTQEVDLCGHATLAAAFVVRASLEVDAPLVRFDTRSGPLTVEADGERLALDFPTRRAAPGQVTDELCAALGVTPLELHHGPYLMAVLADERAVRELTPDFGLLTGISRPVIVTAAGEDCDFVSRFFAPGAGVPEDPVTGSAHCTLTPYWSERLGKRELFARQVSARGGELWCEDRGERTRIGGHARLVVEGRMHLELD